MKKTFTLVSLLILSIMLYACTPSETPNTYDFKSLNPKNDIYYQIFIRSFADSNDDGIGDFNGVTENLDYLVDLGITAIWMLPFNDTDQDWLSYHGYRIKDYYTVNNEYGTMADLENLIQTADSKGIKVLMDLVINHTSDTNNWYLDAKSGINAPFRDFYVWTSQTTVFESFSGGMKDLNLNNPEVVLEIKNIITFWLNKGIKGFRFDAAKNLFLGDPNTNPSSALVKNYTLLRDLQLHARTVDPDVFFLGEVFDYSYEAYLQYYIGLDSLFDFYVANEIWSKVGARSNMQYLASNLERAFKAYKPFNSNHVPSIFISNHDIDRIASRGEYSDVNGLNDLKQSAAVMLTLPGSPHIYYGEELAMKGTNFENTPDHGKNLTGQGIIYDQYRRAPYKWGDQAKETTWLLPYLDSNQNISLKDALLDDNSLVNYYKTFTHLRLNNPALMYGNYFESWNGSETFLQGYIRQYTYEEYSQTLLVVHNMSDSTRTLDVEFTKFIYGSSLEIPKFGTVILELDSTKINTYI